MLKVIALSTAVVILAVAGAEGATLKVLSEFSGPNGAYPRTGLTFDTNGRLFGTSSARGTSNAGTIFSVTPPSGASTVWSLASLFSFPNFGSPNYIGPQGGRLYIDAAGQLYGATYGVDCGQSGNQGITFKLTPPTANGRPWTAKTLVAFSGADGRTSSGGLIPGPNGHLYGTTVCGGTYGYGTVFDLIPPAPNATSWTKAKLLDFNGTTGSQPRGAGLVSDPAGNLYGTTARGGLHSRGTVFRLTPPASATGKWTRKTLIDFDDTNGNSPSGALIRNAAGNFFGVTWSGGSLGYGTVFMVSPPAAGTTAWRLKTLANFDKSSGANPLGALTFAPNGNLYGAARTGATSCSAVAASEGCGVIFELKRSASAPTGWSKSNLVLFDGNNGAWPNGDLIVDEAGKIYGTTYYGGSKNLGLVFQLAR